MDDIEVPEPAEIEEQKEKSFTRRLALMTAGYAVILAVTALGGGNATKEMLLSQQRASDVWAFYQAKATKEHQYHLAKLRAELDLAERGAHMEPPVRAQLEAQLLEMTTAENRYAGEKKELEAEARKLERERDVNRTKDPFFDFGEVFLHVAIVMASISILASSRFAALFSVLLAISGAALAMNGYFLFFR